MDDAWERGRLLVNLKKYEAALAQFIIALKEDPSNADILNEIAWCEYRLDRLDAAANTTDRAIECNPNSARAHYLKCFIHESRNLQNSAIESIQEALRLEPDHADYLAKLADLCLDRNDVKKAEDAIKRGLELDPENVELLTNKAILHEMQNQPKASRKALEQALNLSPDDANAHATRAWIALDAGDTATARASFLEALRIDPQHYSAQIGLWYSLLHRYFFLRPSLWIFRWVWPTRKSGSAAFYGIHFLALVGLVIAGRFTKHPLPWWIYAIWVISTTKQPYRWFLAAHTPLFEALLTRDPVGMGTLTPQSRKTAWTVGFVHAVTAVFLAVGAYKQDPFLLQCAFFTNYLLAMRAANWYTDTHNVLSSLVRMAINVPTILGIYGGLYYLHRNPANPPDMGTLTLFFLLLSVGTFVFVLPFLPSYMKHRERLKRQREASLKAE